jgi:glycerophosphoryl diester phosphodiesterase
VERSLPARGGRRLPDLVAHRGYASRYPENTLSALAAAIEAGARFVEVDVQLSSDLHPFLFHDRTLERMCGASGPVHVRTRAELAALPCSEPGTFGTRFESERIADLPGLVALLAKHEPVFAFVEIKRASIDAFGSRKILDALLPLLEPVRARVALISFSIPFLVEARRHTPIPLGAVFDAWNELDSREVEALAADYVFCDVEGLPAAGSLALDPARVAVYEVADPARAAELGDRGVTLVETFAIGEMIAAFGELHGRQSGPAAP